MPASPREFSEGWAFEFHNVNYPDIDDTAMVLLALMHAKGSDPAVQTACERRAVNWLLAMQSGFGGYACRAFQDIMSRAS